MIATIKRLNPFKKSLAGLLGGFTSLSSQLVALAQAKLSEAAIKVAQARSLMVEVEAAEREAEEALAVSDRIDDLVGKYVADSSAV